MNASPLSAALARVDELATAEDWVIAATIRGLIRGYDARWGAEQRHIELRAVEHCYQAPLINLETGHRSRTFSLVGLLDKTADDGDEEIIFDHKTTSSDISDPSGFYWRHLIVDSQPALYEILARSNGRRVSRVVWDVVRKPAIKPKEITIAQHKACMETGGYCGFRLSTETLGYLIETRRENAEMFEYRVAADSVNDTQKFFARRSVNRTDAMLAEYNAELWDVAAQIREAKRRNRWTRNSGACFSYNRPCPFLSLCSGTDSPDSGRWQAKPSKHPSLPDGMGGDRVLSNSRVRCFQTCQRKFFYEYELKIERVQEDRDEPLYFGSLWGEVLNVWWTSFNQEKDDGSNEQPGGVTGSRLAEAGLAG